jgi:predicted polyphosphate/ATP-dependent NAD kinase
MTSGVLEHSEAAASVLALMVAANGRIDERELRMLDELDAYRRLGVSRQRFLELSRQCLDDVGVSLNEHAWLPVSGMQYLNDLLNAVTDPALRLLVCRLAAATITADGHITEGERLVYEHALARWHISQSMVSQAILADRRA